jgi:hypothetical protein
MNRIKTREESCTFCASGMGCFVHAWEDAEAREAELRRRLARALRHMRFDQRSNCPGHTKTFYCGCAICVGLDIECREIRARRRKESP